MVFFRQFRHLLPNARAWRITVDKQLRQFFEGLANSTDDIRNFIDLVWQDIDPTVTRQLDLWDAQFGLPANVTSDAERRTRLAAAWSAIAGQSPRYLQDTLQANGFNVYVHDAWDVSALPALVYYVPGVYLGGVIFYINECNEAVAACGEATAQCGERLTPAGYPLVNKFSGAPVYTVGTDPTKYPYYLYISAQNFGDPAQVPTARREEFEDLLLKICPAQLWLGVIVDYI